MGHCDLDFFLARLHLPLERINTLGLKNGSYVSL